MIPIFNAVLILDKNENTINNSNILSKYSDKLYGNIVYKMKTEMSSFFQGPASIVFAVISKFLGLPYRNW